MNASPRGQDSLMKLIFESEMEESETRALFTAAAGSNVKPSSSDVTKTKATGFNPALFLSCLFPAAEHSPGRHGYLSFLPRSLPMHRL